MIVIGSDPVTIIGQVNSAIECSSGDWGTLCTWPLINKWAKYKPTRYHTLGLTGKASGSDYWQGENTLGTAAEQTCGILMPKAEALYVNNYRTETGCFLYKLMHGLLAWDYQKPTGGVGASDYPYRIMDFQGYNSECVSPLPAPPDSGTITVPSGVLSFFVQIKDGLPQDNVSLSGMRPPTDPTLPASQQPQTMADLYIAIVCYNHDYSRVFWASSTEPIKNRVSSLEPSRIRITNFPTNMLGDYKARLFLSSKVLTSFVESPVKAGGFVACDMEEVSLTLAAAAANYEVAITYDRWEGTRFHYTVQFKNNTSSAVSVTEMKVEFLQGSTVVYTDTIGTQTISANDSYAHSSSHIFLSGWSGTMRVSGKFNGTLVATTKSI